jgi:hypothetical protein
VAARLSGFECPAVAAVFFHCPVATIFLVSFTSLFPRQMDRAALACVVCTACVQLLPSACVFWCICLGRRHNEMACKYLTVASTTVFSMTQSWLCAQSCEA